MGQARKVAAVEPFKVLRSPQSLLSRLIPVPLSLLPLSSRFHPSFYHPHPHAALTSSHARFLVSHSGSALSSPHRLFRLTVLRILGALPKDFSRIDTAFGGARCVCVCVWAFDALTLRLPLVCPTTWCFSPGTGLLSVDSSGALPAWEALGKWCAGAETGGASCGLGAPAPAPALSPLPLVLCFLAFIDALRCAGAAGVDVDADLFLSAEAAVYVGGWAKWACAWGGERWSVAEGVEVGG